MGPDPDRRLWRRCCAPTSRRGTCSAELHGRRRRWRRHACSWKTRRSTPPASARAARAARRRHPRRRRRPGRQNHLPRTRQLVGYPITRLPSTSSSSTTSAGSKRPSSAARRFGCDRRPRPGPLRGLARRRRGWPERKVAAIGIGVARGVTMHGFSLNADVDLAGDDRFVPYGIADAGVTDLVATSRAARRRRRGRLPGESARSAHPCWPGADDGTPTTSSGLSRRAAGAPRASIPELTVAAAERAQELAPDRNQR